MAIRMRSPNLRLLPSYTPSNHGCCRYCGIGEENGCHLIACPELPDHLRVTKQAIADEIAQQAGIPHHATRKGANVINMYIINFDWRHQSLELLKRLLVFCRNLLNHYAAHKPENWTRNEKLASYPVRRVRPLHRKVAHVSP